MCNVFVTQLMGDTAYICREKSDRLNKVNVMKIHVRDLLAGRALIDPG